MKKQGQGYFPDDCWELKFQKLREDDERDLDSISLVSKRFLSISNRMKLSLNVTDETLPLLPNLLRRFRHIETIVIKTHARKTHAHKEIGGLIDDQIARSNIDGLVDDEDIDGLVDDELVDDQIARSDIDGLVDDQIARSDIDGLVDDQIARSDIDGLVDDHIARSGLLNLRAIKFWCSTRPPRDGFRALALHRNVKNNLKELKKIVVKGDACFITDKSLISLSTNCVKLRRLSLGINLHSLTSQKLISDKRIICQVAKARPPLKKVKLVGFGDQYPKTHGALRLFFQSCQLTLKELTLRGWPLTHISDFARYLSHLTSIDLDGCFGLTGDTFYILMKSCPLVEILTMAHTTRQEMDTFSQDYLHKNYSMRHLNISKNMWLTDTTLENFGQVCPNLQFLSVNGCPRLTDLGIGEVSKRCPAITQLNIDGLTQVSDVLRRYSDNSVVNLKTLNARGTHINDEGLAMIGNRCPNLQYLDIGFCKEVTDKGVMEVVTNCQRLRDINLIGCEKLSTWQESYRKIIDNNG
ncbi:hypothetical protein RHMOL_Rhmol01G0026700 [Rhododendron molle]|uniref:Uncharacterized protein n=1 Tax=Rhododendron molle TaxID=49168 RepID=A0ACC0PYV5_RHOML|nr:hypothetical protein RHMOL_Rhmol01G0026700 [Rhododendron molle]